MVTKTKTEKKQSRYVFYVNLEEYYPRSWLARTLMPETREQQIHRVKADITRSEFFNSDEKVIVVPSQSTHLDLLWEGR